MIGQFDYSNKNWIRGDGRGAIWEKIDYLNFFIQDIMLNRKL